MNKYDFGKEDDAPYVAKSSHNKTNNNNTK